MKTGTAKALLITAIFAAPCVVAQEADDALEPAVDTSSMSDFDPAVDTSAVSDFDAMEPAVNTSAGPDLDSVEPAVITTADGDDPNVEPAVSGDALASSGSRNSGPVMDRMTLSRTEITGNQELPKVMYIVPWQKSVPGDLMGRPVNTLLDEVLAPIDREEFVRQVDYYGDLYGSDEE